MDSQHRYVKNAKLDKDQRSGHTETCARTHTHKDVQCLEVEGAGWGWWTEEEGDRVERVRGFRDWMYGWRSFSEEGRFCRAGFMIVENRNRRTCGAQANVPISDTKAVSNEKADRMMVYFYCFMKVQKRITGLAAHLVNYYLCRIL